MTFLKQREISMGRNDNDNFHASNNNLNKVISI